MNGDFNFGELSKLKHWQVMDPAPEIFQHIKDPIFIANVLKAQIEYKQEILRSQTKAMEAYYGSIGKMLNKMTEKQPIK